MHQLTRETSRRGFTLVEVVIVIILLGIIAAVAVGRLTTSLETARVEQTKAEMQALARAIVGNPDVYSRGARTDFGYVGDIGALPFSLDNLVTNPGYASWNGPYLTSGRRWLPKRCLECRLRVYRHPPQVDRFRQQFG